MTPLDETMSLLKRAGVPIQPATVRSVAYWIERHQFTPRMVLVDVFRIPEPMVDTLIHTKREAS